MTKRFGLSRRLLGRAIFAVQQATDLGRDPHFVREYRRLVRRLQAEYPTDEAMSLAVGGGYKNVGRKLADITLQAGLKKGHSLLDLGCGSGRLPAALCRRVKISYTGVDIIPELLAYARTKAPASYRFVQTRDLLIPAPDASVDMVTAFSLFTHLNHEETYSYLGEIRRVLKPGGGLVFSFLEFAQPDHWSHFQQSIDGLKLAKKGQLNAFIERSVVLLWATRLGFSDVSFTDSDLGQTVGVMR